MSAWLALVVTDVIAVASFARCFTGPGELTVALITLLLAHLAGFAGRGGASAMRAALRGGSETEEGDLGSRRGSRSRWWALGIVVAVLLPVVWVLGPAFIWAGHGIWHTMPSDLRAAWVSFVFRLAPVPELPGLVLALAWAAGAAGLATELLSSERRIPAVFALVPALTLYLVASGLGTDSWRVLGLALMAGSACWYLVAVVFERERAQGVLVASVESGLSLGERAASYRAGAVMLRMAVLAALAAAVIGVNLPGARSAALVTWRGTTTAASSAATSPQVGNTQQGVGVSTFVQVAEEEVEDSSRPLFTVHSATPTREMIAALDDFNGNSWAATPSPAFTPLRSFAPPLRADERRPPPATATGPGQKQLVQLFEVSGLTGGFVLPSWGTPVAVADAGRAERDGSGGPIVSDVALRRGSVYAVDSLVSDPSPTELETASPKASDLRDLQLPKPVPALLVKLARNLVVGATSAYQEALDLDAYLTSPGFHYQLPLRGNGGVVTPSPGYGGLLSFLFKTRTGYCQQFATAFAVLARIDKLPTRIAVGFLPGTPVGHDEWQVDGSDTHAWPQVQFENYGWIDFEPTPGTSVQGSSAPGLPTTTATTVPVATPTGPTGGHNLVPPPGGGASTSRLGRHGGGTRRVGASPAIWLLAVPAGLLCWAGSLGWWRRSRRRRSRRAPSTGILAAWSEALRTLDLAGIRRRRAETHMELARRVTATGMLSTEAELAFANLARFATEACYAGSQPGDFAARQAELDARTVVGSARRRVARWQLVAAALDPRSLH
ncbi:MAG: transglutaminase-like domain-containing protein [Acidimicrobiales bacterium]|jgi:transglutaminase-like putative cysteine protease